MSKGDIERSIITFVSASGAEREVEVSRSVWRWTTRMQQAIASGDVDANELIEQMLACLTVLLDGAIARQRTTLVELLLLMVKEANLASNQSEASVESMVSVSQAALEIGAHVSSVRQAAQTGRVEAVKRGRNWYVRRGDLAALRPHRRKK